MEGLTRIFCLAVFLFTSVSGNGQSSLEELKREQSRLSEKINLANKLLSDNHTQKVDVENKLSILSKKIQTRRLLIKSIENELINVRERQQVSELEVKKLRQQKDDLVAIYSHILVSSYRSKLLKNRWLFLFTAHSLPQLYQRWHYLKQLNDGVQDQITKINETVEGIDLEITNLRNIEQEKQKVLQAQDKERKILDQDLNKEKVILTTLAKEEKRLKTNIKESQKSQEKLKTAILKAINENKGTRKNLPLTPAMAKLSSSFSTNKGKLPWPVGRGLIVRSFGKQGHPSLKNVTVSNNGIDISTDPATPIKAIFEGTVVGQQFIPGYDHMVIISHGDFYTVYSYLASTTVSKGDKVKTGDAIGMARERSGAGQVHLEIWHGRELLDPQSWLKDH